MNKVVARYADGRVIKGSTGDFVPSKQVFHVLEANAPPGSRPVQIRTSELKAIFFVKDFSGRPEHQMRQEFDPQRPVVGRRIKVVFGDGEVIVGTTQGYQPDRAGFFLLPADSECNIDRCYDVASATAEITVL